MVPAMSPAPSAAECARATFTRSAVEDGIGRDSPSVWLVGETLHFRRDSAKGQKGISSSRSGPGPNPPPPPPDDDRLGSRDEPSSNPPPPPKEPPPPPPPPPSRPSSIVSSPRKGRSTTSVEYFSWPDWSLHLRVSSCPSR